MDKVLYKITDDNPKHANDEANIHNLYSELCYLDKVFSVEELAYFVVIN